MAITINVAAAKKLPHPTEQYGSIQATVSLSGECGSIADAPAVMHDLFTAAQAGVDQHLAQQVGAPAPVQPAAPRATSQTRPSAASQPRQASQPYRSTGGPRRGSAPAPVTESQLRFLSRLIDQTKASLPAILDQYQVGGLDQLSCRDAAGLIDSLKAQAA
jgi:hypothetical protein